MNFIAKRLRTHISRVQQNIFYIIRMLSYSRELSFDISSIHHYFFFFRTTKINRSTKSVIFTHFKKL